MPSPPLSNENSLHSSFDLPPIPSALPRKLQVHVATNSTSDENKENNPLPHRNVQNSKSNEALKSWQLMKSNHGTRKFLNSQRNHKTSSLSSPSFSSSASSMLLNGKNKRQFLDTERDVSSIRARIQREASSPSLESSSSKEAVPKKIALTGTYKHGQNRTSAISSSIRNRILRYGETIDSLFCLAEDCSEEHRNLCNDIVNGIKTEDTEAWKIVLDYASVKFKKGDDGQNLIRLHRRATSRLINARTSMEIAPGHLLSIYISYARAQSLFTSSNDARQTYKYILNRHIGEYDAALYVAISDFELKEGRLDLAKDSLQRGLVKNAQPTELLKRRLNELEGKDDCKDEEKVTSHEKNTYTENESQKIRIPPLPSSKSITKNHSISSSPKDAKEHQIEEIDFEMDKSRTKENVELDDKDISFSQKKQIDAIQQAQDENIEETIPLSIISIENTFNSNMSGTEEPLNSSQISLSLEFDIQPKTTNVMEPQNSESDDREVEEEFGANKSKRKFSEKKKKEKNDHVSAKEVLTKSLNTFENNVKVSTSTSPALNQSKYTRSRLAGLRAKNKSALLNRHKKSSKLGGAERVDPNTSMSSMPDSDESDLDEMSSEVTPGSKKRVEDFSKPSPKVPKITRTDLSYMLDWDPSKSRKQSSSPSSAPLSQSRRCFDIGPSMEKIEEESPTEGQSTVGGGNEGSTQTHVSDNSATSDRSREKDKTEDSNQVNDIERNPNSSQKSPTERMQSNDGRASFPYSPREAALMANANVEFLPLVSEDNICSVNSIPYAKLGVIGKGGSCKVYRALSKECAVLAIKKVKLEGMDQKAINGYANEIALLKRLRGNPAIIQLYDSEVDYVRKSIFLVMELGEVDLNHVLQKQARMQQANKGAPGRFNINFIRLTWQQMLSAVHSIHEERIIHSDLKPANFLFVRGALKLIDFGIAKAMQSEDTTNIYRDSQIGTLNYMSPEAILDTGSGGDKARMRLGRASDIWSLGCILYQMIYGRTPFADLHMIQKLQAIVNPNHEIMYPKVSEEAAIDAIKLCLQRDPSKRPPIVGKGGLLNEHWFLNSNS